MHFYVYRLNVFIEGAFGTISQSWKTFGKTMVALEINISFLKSEIHSMQGWTVTTRHDVASKRKAWKTYKKVV